MAVLFVVTSGPAWKINWLGSTGHSEAGVFIANDGNCRIGLEHKLEFRT
jgi:hypothetical protein